ncbi:MAG: hypothetical protein FWB78_08115 [Treponema sp.]|nr:hypothetical protein [Treponema sp.]
MAARVDRYGRIINERQKQKQKQKQDDDHEDNSQTDWGEVLVAGLAGLAGLAVGVIAVLLADD